MSTTEPGSAGGWLLVEVSQARISCLKMIHDPEIRWAGMTLLRRRDRMAGMPTRKIFARSSVVNVSGNVAQYSSSVMYSGLSCWFRCASAAEEGSSRRELLIAAASSKLFPALSQHGVPPVLTVPTVMGRPRPCSR